MATIRDLARVSPWRAKLLPASFRDANFHVESGSRENGRRIVTHEFPKKDYPYSEDMGRRAIEFSVRAYCIQFVTDANQLYNRDYRIARDALQERLEEGQPGVLQLPTLKPLMVVCARYRLTEEERAGGYCVFDLSFVELGAPPFQPVANAYTNLVTTSQGLTAQVVNALSFPKPPVLAPIPIVPSLPPPPSSPPPEPVVAPADRRRNVQG
jgi:prophage DNA circulation protein